MYPIDDILTEIETRLGSLQVELRNGKSAQAFGCVKRFDATDLAEAFSQLIVSQQRVALIVYTGERFENAGTDAGQVCVRRIVELTILTSDRVLGKRMAAVFGSDTTPGALRLQSACRDALAGEFLPAVSDTHEAIDCVPILAETISIQDIEEKQPGRVAARLDIECRDRNATPYPADSAD